MRLLANRTSTTNGTVPQILISILDGGSLICSSFGVILSYSSLEEICMTVHQVGHTPVAFRNISHLVPPLPDCSASILDIVGVLSYRELWWW